jgi:multidrug efflux pump
MILDVYVRSLRWALQWPSFIMLSLLVTLCLPSNTSSMFQKGYLPKQDNGLIWGSIQADQSTSFQLMRKKLAQFIEIIRQDPAVAKIAGFYSSGSSGSAFVVLKPLSERRESAEEVINRLQPKFDQIAGASLYLGTDPDVQIDGQIGNSAYQYTLLGKDTCELYRWAQRSQTLSNICRCSRG